MAYAEWVSVDIVSRGFNVRIKNAQLKSGRFYHGNKENAVPTEKINSMYIREGHSVTIYASGLEDVTGSEGSFDIYDGDIRVGTFSWNCPGNGGTNYINWEHERPWENNPREHDMNSENKLLYVSQLRGGNPFRGEIGNILLRVLKLSNAVTE